MLITRGRLAAQNIPVVVVHPWGGERNWAVGDNSLVLLAEEDKRVSYPFFFGPDVGRCTQLLEFPSKILNRNHRVKAYVPPGYRRLEADEFYASRLSFLKDEDECRVARQALAGMLWSKHYYEYDVEPWLAARQRRTRNAGWFHMVNADVIAMPDKWEYPWYAAGTWPSTACPWRSTWVSPSTR